MCCHRSQLDRPCVVWGCNGYFAYIFYFLGARFLSAPDHVLECEAIHARWKWWTMNRRRLKLKSLNAYCKIHDYILQFDELPPDDDLEPHIIAAKAAYRDAMTCVRDEGFDNPSASMYHDRFNILPHQISLLKEIAGPRHDPPQTATTAWACMSDFSSIRTISINLLA